MSYMFTDCKSLSSLDLSNFNTDNVCFMDDMFSGCESLTYLNLSNFNTQKVSDLWGIFAGCSSLKKESLIAKDERILNEEII
jgi:surface protein